MKHFFGLSIAASLAVFVTACSSSSTPSGGANTDEDSGAHTTVSDSGTQSDSASSTDSGSSTGDDAASTACTPVAPPAGDGGVPNYTAPAVNQKVCAAADITAFITACGDSTGTADACVAYQKSGAAACTSCLFSNGSNLAPIELVISGSTEEIIPGLGACIIAGAGTAADACAVAVDEGNICAELACSQCTTQTAGNACAKATETGVCSTYASGESACSSYQTVGTACVNNQGTDATLTNEANVICGAGAVDAGAGTVDAGGDSGK